jgi:hypothetical protein
MDSEFVTLIESEHFHVVVVPAHEFVHAKRLAQTFATVAECESAHELVARKLDTLNRRRTRMLFDLRAAPGRNDPEFEEAIAVHRKRIFERFLAAAIIVRTASGKMQVTRHMRDDGNAVEVFLDVPEAYRYIDVPFELESRFEP